MRGTVTPIERDWMTLEELAQRMGIGLTAAYELANQDRLPVPAHRIGRQFRFSRPAYDALLHRQHRTGTTEPTAA